MKKTIKIILIVLIAALTLSLFGCEALNNVKNAFWGGIEDVENAIDSIGAYTFSDVVITQEGLNTFRIDFTVRCGDDPVEIYLTDGYRLTDSHTAKNVAKVKDGQNTRFSFTETLDLGETYYIWAVYGDKQEKLGITAPSMFPVLMDQGSGEALFHFKYTYGTSWSDFCDPEGKAIYQSEKPVFDSGATLIADKIEITQEDYLIPADVFNPDMYYFAVSTVKDGLITIISRPVISPDKIVGKVNGITASITSDLYFRVDVELSKESISATSILENLQLLVKTDIADDVLVADCTYADGIATMMVDYNQLDWDGVWYDVCLAWNGAIVADIPQYFAGKQVNQSSTVKVDGIIYGIAGWKAGDAPEHSEVLKMYFEEDTTRYADELCKSYIVTFSVDPEPTLNVTVKLKDGVKAPTLAITGGDNNKLCEVEGILNDDGTYTYSLPVKTGLTTPDKWYDIRFFQGNKPYEFLKDSCITYANFAASYVDAAGGRSYYFREYNGFLKLMYLNN